MRKVKRRGSDECRNYLNPKMKKDAQLPATILFDSPESETVKRLIGNVSAWSKNSVESDWRLQCRTGKRLCDLNSIMEILNEFDTCRHLAPRSSDYYFFKLLETIDSPNQEGQVSPKLEQRNKDLSALCNATEVIDGFAILAAGGEDKTNPKAPITIDSNTTEERRFVPASALGAME